jgi:Carboxypeptidase regulatory-like domain
MSRRSERLNRLVIQSPCAESWEAMSGAGAAGAAGSDSSGCFCPRCNKHVHDLAAMEAREVEALVAATRGRFCARITRDRAGRLVTRPPAAPFPVPGASSPADSTRRASAVAAAVVGAMVGWTGAAWAGAPGPSEPSGPALPPPPAPAPVSGAASPGAQAPETPPEPVRPRAPGVGRAAGAVLGGEVMDEQGLTLPGVTVVLRDADLREWSVTTGHNGSFVFSGLPAGIYTLEAALEGFEFVAEPNLVLQPGTRRQIALTGQTVYEEEITVGAVATVAEPLLPAFRASRLAVIATVGPSALVTEAREGSLRTIRTELQVVTVLKGTLRGGTVLIDRFEPQDDESDPQVGETVLAFLTHPEAGSSWADDAAYVTVDSFDGLRQLPADSLEAYRRQTAALARLGETPRADALVEWLVATAEDEHTREEGVGQLRWAMDSLQVLGEQWDRRRAQPGRAEELDPQAETDRLLAQAGAPADEVEPAVLAALLTPAHRERLSRALLATERLTDTDIRLYELVRPWAGEAAERWLARQLAGEPVPDGVAQWAMRHLAEDLQDEGLQKLLDEADDEIDEACTQVPSELDEAETERRDRRIEAIEHELRRKFLRALHGRL